MFVAVAVDTQDVFVQLVTVTKPKRRLRHQFYVKCVALECFKNRITLQEVLEVASIPHREVSSSDPSLQYLTVSHFWASLKHSCLSLQACGISEGQSRNEKQTYSSIADM